MASNIDYETRLKRARRKRNNIYQRAVLLIIALVVLVVIIAISIFSCVSKKDSNVATSSSSLSPQEASESIARQKELEEEQTKQAVIDSYSNLGIVQVDGYLNIRESADSSSDIIGKLYDGSGCELLSSPSDGWYKISSGGIEGFVNSSYMLTGDEAKKVGYTYVKKRAFINTDRLNIRKEPSTDADVVDTALKNERYEVVAEVDGWVQILSGYISADYVTVDYALNEARKLDLRTMVLNMYNNLGISNVDNYLNIREEPSENATVIGKMPSKAAGDILETTEDGAWYKIQSGAIKGYVKSDYILTGQAAKDEALSQATLMAIVETDVLNARSEPNTDAKIWTQISNAQRYPVVSQMDGWVEVEMEEDTTAFLATDYVDVRYALPEAVKFSALEEANARRTQIVNFALQFLGNPYVWGGTSLTNGCDCSGFTLSVMGHFGVYLPHYSGSQAQMGKAVTSSEMRPGDLVFYANSSGTINHVGIYIGNGQIVNAASRRSGIKISAWNYRTPKAIRNVLGD